MPDKKLTDSEIKKALECCAVGNSCKGKCPLDDDNDSIKICTSTLSKSALDLINRLQAENERLNIVHRYIDKVVLGNQNFAIADEYLFAYQETLKQLYNNVNAKAEAYKECIEKVKGEILFYSNMTEVYDFLDNLLKEFERKEDTIYDD